MLQRDIIGLPTNVYPIDPWALVETEFSPQYTAQTETLFAISNGYLGMRAVHIEGRPYCERGTFINGFHEQWAIQHAEEAYGFAKVGQTLIAAPDARRFHIYIDDEAFTLQTAQVSDYERRLDFKTGVLSRSLVWHLPSGLRAHIKSESFVSLVHRHLVCTRLQVTMLEGSAPISVSSQLRKEEKIGDDDWDPRKAKGFTHEVLLHKGSRATTTRQCLEYQVAQSRMNLACAIDHSISCEQPVTLCSDADAVRGKLVATTMGKPGSTLEIIKYGTFHTDPDVPTTQLADRCDRSLTRALESSWDDHLKEHAAVYANFWKDGDITIGGNDMIQQAIRWSLFQIYQNSVRADGMGVPAKGLTGSAYEGHYFWDTEIYVLPMLVYSNPKLARNLLLNRYSMLDKARDRAKELNEQGALFPWRTITGDEASAYYEAGTAQYHINADIAYAVSMYVDATDDQEFLEQYGAEILVETARMWASLGFYADGSFHIHGVTGPDEYTTVVDDNAYTNLMAASNLRTAAAVVKQLEEYAPQAWAKLVAKTRLHPSETSTWLDACNSMYMPHDDIQGITPQDAHFLDLQPWDWEGTPREKYPLLLNFHPLVIYRHQVIKQADVVLAMFLHEDFFDLPLMKSNFDYYDPITTGDSSLSTSVQSIIASRIGNLEKAIEYYRYGVFMDMANVAGNTGDGVHVAAAGGVWLSTVCGFGGFNPKSNPLEFSPRLPSSWSSMAYVLTLAKGNKLAVEVHRGEVTYTLRSADPQANLAIKHEQIAIDLQVGNPVTLPITSKWEDEQRNHG